MAIEFGGVIMAEVTNENVISAVATAIRSKVSTSEIAEIYKDTPVQQVVRPYIFIDAIQSEETPMMGDYSMWNFIVDVRCHPTDNHTMKQTWGRNLALKLLRALSRITVASQRVKARRIEWHMEEDVLHILCSYSFRVFWQEPMAPFMETMTYGEAVKN